MCAETFPVLDRTTPSPSSEYVFAGPPGPQAVGTRDPLQGLRPASVPISQYSYATNDTFPSSHTMTIYNSVPYRTDQRSEQESVLALTRNGSVPCLAPLGSRETCYNALLHVVTHQGTNRTSKRPTQQPSIMSSNSNNSNNSQTNHNNKNKTNYNNKSI